MAAKSTYVARSPSRRSVRSRSCARTPTRLRDLMDDWDEDLGGMDYRLVVPTDTALATVLQVSRPAVAGMERQGRITREPNGQWDVWAVIADWRQTTRAAMQQRAAVRPWLDARRPLDASTVIDLVRATRAVGGVVQAQWGSSKWLDARDPLDQLRDGVPLEAHDTVELDVLSPSATNWHGRFCLLAIHLAEHFQLDPTAVREFVVREGSRAIVDFVRWEMGEDGDGDTATASDEIEEATA
jgi:hypothetical protein